MFNPKFYLPWQQDFINLVYLQELYQIWDVQIQIYEKIFESKNI